MKYRAITISGEIASGKSVLASELIELLPGWTRVNTGQRLREFCEAEGMSIQEVSFVPDDVHRRFDASQKEFIRSGEQIIVEGRLSGWLAHEIEDVFRIFCYAPAQVRAERYMGRDKVLSVDQALEEIEYRESRDVEKFRAMYQVEDYRDPVFYNLRLDTSTGTPRELALQVLEAAGCVLSSSKP